jgi:hypothetical protein
MNIQLQDNNGQQEPKEMQFRQELENLINRYSKENGSNTPDFILANFLERCLIAFDLTVLEREAWYGRPPAIPLEPINPNIKATQ